MGKLTLIWHGHSCFTLEEDGYSIVLDPFGDGAVPGFGPLKLTADRVLCSHGHFDHNAVQCVRISEDAAAKKNPFRMTEIHSWHDEAQGTKRGENIIRIYDDGEYKVAHMGDIGCMPTAEQKALLKGIDVMLMPVGGFFTMEPEDVHVLVQELKPRMLVPMHYRSDDFGYDVIATLDRYLDLCAGENVIRLNKNSLSLPEDLAEGIVVLNRP